MNIIFSILLLAQIDGPSVVPTYQLASLSTAVVADKYIWLAEPVSTSFPATQSSDPKLFEFTGTPGDHTIILITITNNKQSISRKKVTFQSSVNPLEQLGIDYGIELRQTFAHSLLEAANDVEKGVEIEAAREAHQIRWAATRNKAFNDKFVSLLDAIGPRPYSAQQQKEYVSSLQTIARGVGK